MNIWAYNCSRKYAVAKIHIALYKYVITVLEMHVFGSSLTIIWLVFLLLLMLLLLLSFWESKFSLLIITVLRCAHQIIGSFQASFDRCNYMHPDTHTNKLDEVRHLFSYTGCSHPTSTS